MKNKSLIFLLLIAFCICRQPVFAQNSKVVSVYFTLNSFSINDQYKDSLYKVIKSIKSGSFIPLKIFGYADKTGSDKYNNTLSKKRAYAVYNYLISKCKFDKDKIYIEWLGKSDNGYDLHLPEAHIQERCVDILIYTVKKISNK